MSEALHQAVGELRGRLGALEDKMKAHEVSTDTRLARLEEKLEERFTVIDNNLANLSKVFTEKLDAMTSTFNQAKGGWKALSIVSAVLLTIGGAAWTVFSFIAHKVWP